ncbi:MAG: DUF1501 domain-containing protein, partial [Verrucomicrobiota bacterium]
MMRDTPTCPGRLPSPISRRQFLTQASMGFGALSLSSLMAGQRHAVAPCKNVIFCFMPGGVSHIDSFDPKPALTKHHGRQIGKWANEKSMGANPNRRWKQSPWMFKTYGQSGMPVSELFPHIASCVDDLALIRSMVAEVPLHAGANLFLHTGRLRSGSPCLGSWITYGLGSENHNLPGYVLLESGEVPPGGQDNFSSGFLPADFQATSIQAEGVPLRNIVPARAARQVRKLAWLAEQDADFARRLGDHSGIEAAIRNYEMAARMQTSIPDIL